MERAILFRGIIKYPNYIFKGFWYGNLILYANGGTFIRQIETGQEFMVIPETIGQYTGLTDKNGVKVFEGDIVKWTYGDHYWEAIISTIPNNKSNTLYAVETFHNCTIDEEKDIYTYERSVSRHGVRNEIEYLSNNSEVIGNIHDKPVL